MSAALNFTVASSLQSSSRILFHNKWSSCRTNRRFAVANAKIAIPSPINASTRAFKRSGQFHTAERRSKFTQNSTSTLGEGATETCDADRPPFDLNLAVLLAGFAFEVYNSPKVDKSTLIAKDVAGCEAIFTSREFAYEEYSGQLVVEVVSATDLPAMDLWGTSDPYVQLSLGDVSARTQTLWTSMKPKWQEEVRLLVKPNSGSKQYLKVSMFDDGILRQPRRMGNANLDIEGLCDGVTHEVEVALEGPGGGATVKLTVDFRSFAELEEEARRKASAWSLSSFLTSSLSSLSDLPSTLTSSLPAPLAAAVSAATSASSSTSSQGMVISASDFVQSVLQSFGPTSAFPSSMDSLPGKATAGASVAAPRAIPPKPDADTAAAASGGNSSDEEQPQWSIAGLARNLLEEADWLPGVHGDNSNEKEAKVEGKQAGEEASLLKDSLSGIFAPLLQQRQAVQSKLEAAGFLTPGTATSQSGANTSAPQASSTPVPAGKDASKEVGQAGGWSVDGLQTAVFQKTEGLLGALALLQATEGATAAGATAAAAAGGATAVPPSPAPQPLLAAPSAAAPSEAAGEGEGEGELEGGQAEEEENLAVEVRRVFGQAETAVEAWSLLASSLGQQTFVKSDFEKVCFVEKSDDDVDTQVAVWRDSKRKRIVVSFRGTEQTKIQDLITDISLMPAGLNPERAGGDNFDRDVMVHGGFLAAYDAVRPRLRSLVISLLRPDRQLPLTLQFSPTGDDESRARAEDEWRRATWHVYVTGHSLGGALSTLFSYELSQSKQYKNGLFALTVYNYGSPRVGNATFAALYNQAVRDSWRVVNSRDIIPTVPKLMGYRHVCCPVYLTPAGFGGDGSGLQADASEEELLKGDGYEGRQVEEASAQDLIMDAMTGERRLVDRLMAAELAMLAAVQDGSALLMHMEDCYYTALLKEARARLRVQTTLEDVARLDDE